MLMLQPVCLTILFIHLAWVHIHIIHVHATCWLLYCCLVLCYTLQLILEAVFHTMNKNRNNYDRTLNTEWHALSKKWNDDLLYMEKCSKVRSLHSFHGCWVAVAFCERRRLLKLYPWVLLSSNLCLGYWSVLSTLLFQSTVIVRQVYRHLQQSFKRAMASLEPLVLLMRERAHTASCSHRFLPMKWSMMVQTVWSHRKNGHTYHIV